MLTFFTVSFLTEASLTNRGCLFQISHDCLNSQCSLVVPLLMHGSVGDATLFSLKFKELVHHEEKDDLSSCGRCQLQIEAIGGVGGGAQGSPARDRS